jgi:hypothetical protein
VGEAPPDPSRKHRVPPREASVNMNPRKDPQVAPDPSGARIGPPPVRDNSRVSPRQPPPEVEGSRAGTRQPPPEMGDISRAGTRRPPPEVGAPPAPRREREGDGRSAAPARVPPPAPRPAERPKAAEPENARVISSPGVRSRGTGVRSALTEEPERPPRVLSGKAATSSSSGALPSRGEGTSVQRRPRTEPPDNSGRGPRGGSR